MKESNLIGYLLIITNLNIVCSDLNLDKFLQASDIIPSKIVSRPKNKEDIADEDDTLELLFGLNSSEFQSSIPPPNETGIQQFFQTLPSNHLNIFNKLTNSNSKIHDEYFLELLKAYANSRFAQKNETCLTTPRKIKFPRTRDDGSVLGRGGLAEHNSMQFPGASHEPTQKNIFPSNSHIEIPILSENQLLKFKLPLKGRRPTRITTSNLPSPTPNHQNQHKLSNQLEQSSSFHPQVARYDKGHWPFPIPTSNEVSPNTFQSQNDVSPILKTPLYGSYGDYSWTIEKGSPELLETEAILPANEIFAAIYQAEKEETKMKEQLKQEQFLSNYYKQRKFTNLNQNVETKPLQHHQESWSHLTPTDDFKEDDAPVNRDRYDSHYYNDNVNSPHLSHYEQLSYANPPSVTSSVYDKPYGLPLSPPPHTPLPPRIHSPSYPLHNHFIDSGVNHSGLTPIQHGSVYNNWMSFDGWMSKVKNVFQTVSTGNYSPDKNTRKILEGSIGVLAFLAFGGYVAALLFQALIPGLAFPLFPGFFNVNVTNPGLFGLLFGRSFKGIENVYFIKESKIDHLDQRVKRALHVETGRLMRVNKK